MEQQQQHQQTPTHRRRHSSDLDMEQLSMVEIEAAISMSEPDAVFSLVLPHYPVGAHIQCHCTVTEERDLAAGCWIGLFKVGWASATTDCVCRAECRKGELRTLVAVFTPNQLPKDTKDFYQFCFVAPDGLVKGASSPFLFRGAPSDDFVAVLDEELQGVVVSARTAKLENDLANMRLEHAAQRSAAEDEAEQLRRRLSDLQEELRLTQEAASAAEEARVELEARVARAESEAARAREELKDHMSTLSRLDEARQSTAARLVGAEDERQRLLRCLEKYALERDEANNEAAAMRQSLAIHVEERARNLETVNRLRDEFDEVQGRLHGAEAQLGEAGEREKALLEQLDACKKATADALSTEREARLQLEASVAQLRADLASRQQLETVSSELRKQQARFDSLLKAYEGVKRQFHVAEDRERLVRVKYDEVIAVNKQMLEREERMHSRLAELQGRLKEGASEYKKLMKNYRDLQRQHHGKMTQQHQHHHQQQQQQSDAVDPAEEFHDAQGDVQSLVDSQELGGYLIHRPPMMAEEATSATAAAAAPRSLPEAAAAMAAAAAATPTTAERFCPVCNLSGFVDQRLFEEHVYSHFPSSE